MLQFIIECGKIEISYAALLLQATQSNETNVCGTLDDKTRVESKNIIKKLNWIYFEALYSEMLTSSHIYLILEDRNEAKVTKIPLRSGPCFINEIY